MYTNFLNRLKKFFLSTLGNKANFLTKVKDSERISRFLVPDHFKKLNMEVKAAAFLPPKDLQMSVYQTTTLDDPAVWHIGKKFVEAKRKDGKSIEARADLFAIDIRHQSLDIVSSPTPHKLHAHIIAWSLEKSSHRLKAAELALRAVLLIKP